MEEHRIHARRLVSAVFIPIAVLTAWHLSSGVAAAQNALPAPWQQADIGDVGIAGSATQGPDGDLFINGAGSDIWGTVDSFHFVYQPIADGQIDTDYASMENTNPFAKIGIMFRQTLDPGSAHVILDMKPDGSVEFMTRATANGDTTFIAGTGPTSHPWALHLARSNGAVTAIICADACQSLGSTPFVDGPAFVGVAITSHDPTVLNHGGFAAGLPHVLTVPQPWFSGDVGDVGLPGSAFFQYNTFTVNGAGADIWGTSDSYHAVRTPIGGGGEIVARVTSEQAANTFAKAGVVMTDGSPLTVILDVRPNGLIEFMARSSSTGQMAFIAGSAASFPVWLRLVRSGNEFTGSMSTDGHTWQVVGSTAVSLANGYMAGVAVTSHDTSTINTSTFDQVTVASANPQDIDVGDVGAAGSYVSQFDVYPSLFSLSGAGADIWGTTDAFNFFYSNLAADGGVQRRVMGFISQDPDPFAKAGVMIRETADASSAHVILDVRPNGQVEFMTRSATGEQTTFIAGATATFPVDLKLTRSGSTVTAAMSTNGGGLWSPVGSVSVGFDSDVLAGAIVTSHQRAVLATVNFE